MVQMPRKAKHNDRACPSCCRFALLDHPDYTPGNTLFTCPKSVTRAFVWTNKTLQSGEFFHLLKCPLWVESGHSLQSHTETYLTVIF